MTMSSKWCLAVLILSTPTLKAESVDWPQRFDRLPEQPNMIAIIHVAELVKRAGMEEKSNPTTSAPTVGDLSEELTKDLNHIAIATSFDLNTLASAWEVSVCSLGKVPSADSLARDERGYVDEIGGKRVIWSPRGVYFLPVDQSKLVIVRPANRQMLARWEKQIAAGKPAGVSDYLREAAAVANSDVPVVIAMDLEGVFAAEALRQQLQGFDDVRKASVDSNQLAPLLADVKGFTFAVQLQSGLKGKLKIDFNRDAKPLANIGKSLVVAMLDRAGASLDEVADWKESIAGTSFSLSGPLSIPTLRTLLSLFDSLGTANRVSQSGEMEQPLSSTTESSALLGPTAEASNKFFRSVTRIIEESRNFKWKTMGEKALWNDRLARKLDNLPILAVDPDLLSYGTDVANLLRGTGVTIREANISAGVEKAGASRSANYSGGYGTGWVNLPNSQLAQVDAQRRAKGNTAAIQNLSTIDGMTAAVRRQMTHKYNVEF